MSRTFSQLLTAMKRLTNGSPTATTLVQRFEKRAVVRHWPRKEFDHEYGTYITPKVRKKNPVFVILLPSGIEPPNTDSLVWRRRALYGRKKELVPLLIVDAAASHEEWFALKAVFEYGAIEIEEIKQELAQTLEPLMPDEPGWPAIGAARAIDHLAMRHASLIADLIDWQFDGLLTSRVRVLNRTLPESMDESIVHRRVFGDLRKLLQKVCPDPLTPDEREARHELLDIATHGLVTRERTDAFVKS